MIDEAGTQLIERWTNRRDELRKLGAWVDGAKLCEEMLADLSIMVGAGNRSFTLTEAAALSGYSVGHLGRLVRRGNIRNAGRPRAPRIYLRDIPHKAGHLPPERVPPQVSTTSKEQIVRSIVDPQ